MTKLNQKLTTILTNLRDGVTYDSIVKNNTYRGSQKVHKILDTSGGFSIFDFVRYEAIGKMTKTIPEATIAVIDAILSGKRLLFRNKNSMEWREFEFESDVITIYDPEFYEYAIGDATKGSTRIQKIQEYNYVCYAKGKYFVTSNRFLSEQEVSAHYQYPVRVISRIDESGKPR